MKVNRYTALGAGWVAGMALIGLASSGITPGNAAAGVSHFVAPGSTKRSDQPAAAAVVSNSAAPAIFASLPKAYAEPAAVVDAHAGAADFSKAEALRRMSIVGSAILSQTAAVDHQNPETGAFVPAAQTSGHVIALDDLQLAEFRFVPKATRYTTSANTSGGFREPTDCWIAVWKLDGVAGPEFNNASTTVEVIVVMEDATGAIHSLTAGKAPSAGS